MTRWYLSVPPQSDLDDLVRDGRRDTLRQVVHGARYHGLGEFDREAAAALDHRWTLHVEHHTDPLRGWPKLPFTKVT
jgi:hypothetical protein